MANKLTWAPNTDIAIASYDIEWSTGFVGPWTFLVNIPHNLSGPNYDTIMNVFFYIDSTLDVTRYYRITAIDTHSLRSTPTAPFQAIVPRAKIDHNFGGTDALTYLAPNGSAIQSAVIRIFLKTEYDAGNTGTALAVTETDAAGHWVSPVFVPAGFDYMLVFAKENTFGPDAVHITVS